MPEIIPTFAIGLYKRLEAMEVKNIVCVVERICDEGGGRVERLFEHRPKGEWFTVVTCGSDQAFTDKNKVEVWWTEVKYRLKEELPHQQLLRDRLEDITFSYTTSFVRDFVKRVQERREEFE
ncbi:hypothetical protein AKJ51_00720 [candidate division MSBL1 archaeon SCGC-AAA382A20]|uniref:Uncharacterized protein n=1 Tax=candidate division MSBL1 archaeon SCGC-AAA382A20 TaxID=1698280 RepID=A0A133VME2_9EURY|nr:hypothetical protein AKJ51_00720 [candidate division MSBL1 archaeon SCGC-AAA382A20]